MPLILVLGSSFTMGGLMIVSSFNSLNSMSNSRGQAIFRIIYIIFMLISIIILPVITVKWERRRKVKYEKKRQEKYKLYIESKIHEINQIMDNQRNALLRNYSSGNECKEIILNRSQRLWERKIEDYDFFFL